MKNVDKAELLKAIDNGDFNVAMLTIYDVNGGFCAFMMFPYSKCFADSDGSRITFGDASLCEVPCAEIRLDNAEVAYSEELTDFMVTYSDGGTQFAYSVRLFY